VTHGKFLEQKVPEEREYDSEGHLNNTPMGITTCRRRKRRAREEKKFLRRQKK